MRLSEIPQLQGASPAEKIELIDDLWASIPPDAMATPESHLEELEGRMRRLKESPEKALTPKEARGRIRARTGL